MLELDRERERELRESRADFPVKDRRVDNDISDKYLSPFNRAGLGGVLCTRAVFC